MARDCEDSASIPRDIRESYDAVARTYADEIYAELRGKPFDRELLDRFAERVRGRGWVCDVGCGPAQIARYLSDRGAEVFGLDLSAGMLAEARRLNPDFRFVQSSMTALGLAAEALFAITAFYSIIHIPRRQVVTVLAEMLRVLKAGGPLLLTFHLGTEDSYHEEMLGHRVRMNIASFTTEEMIGYLRVAGFQVDEVLERDPYAPEVEYQSRRGYILASRPLKQVSKG
jgi:ubiquinone/menaquinone biosynthesis C-methylase UbiE